MWGLCVQHHVDYSPGFCFEGPDTGVFVCLGFCEGFVTLLKIARLHLRIRKRIKTFDLNQSFNMIIGITGMKTCFSSPFLFFLLRIFQAFRQNMKYVSSLSNFYRSKSLSKEFISWFVSMFVMRLAEKLLLNILFNLRRLIHF